MMAVFWIGLMNSNIFAALRAACVAGVIGGAVGAVLAHGNATGIVAERMHGMMQMARSIKHVTEAVESGAADPAVVQEAAKIIGQHAGNALVALFPEGSIDAPSEASPAIWENWPEFVALANRLDALGSELARARIAPAPDHDTVTPASKPASKSPASIWASLDERVLLGLSPRPVAETKSMGSTPEVPSLTATLSAITGTCAQCHEAFRRASQ